MGASGPPDPRCLPAAGPRLPLRLLQDGATHLAFSRLVMAGITGLGNTSSETDWVS